METITPCLWFNNQAEEAVNFYLSIFKNSLIKSVNYYGKGAPMPEGSVMTINFILNGKEFLALNGGPVFSFSPAISFIVNCETQQEVDEYWEKLSEGGGAQQCGWLEDKFGVTWQIVPTALIKMLTDPDKAKSQRVNKAMMQMKKLDIHILKQAYEQEF
jgi:predicted 3-demethylubiquinone-9 3-methyltransferase (glyoxalase superfamily)